MPAATSSSCEPPTTRRSVDAAAIDVWLRSMRDNGALMITLANTLRALEVVAQGDRHGPDGRRQRGGGAEVAANLRSLFAKARLVVDVDVIVDARPIRR